MDITVDVLDTVISVGCTLKLPLTFPVAAYALDVITTNADNSIIVTIMNVISDLVDGLAMSF
jgi:hypothetical protein